MQVTLEQALELAEEHGKQVGEQTKAFVRGVANEVIKLQAENASLLEQRNNLDRAVNEQAVVLARLREALESVWREGVTAGGLKDKVKDALWPERKR